MKYPIIKQLSGEFPVRRLRGPGRFDHVLQRLFSDLLT